MASNLSFTKTGKGKLKYSFEDRLFNFVKDSLMLLAALIVLYPLIYILSSAFSSPDAVAKGRVVFFPVDFSLRGFEEVFSHKAIVTGFANSIFYTIVGTLVNLVMTVAAAIRFPEKLAGTPHIALFVHFYDAFNGVLFLRIC